MELTNQALRYVLRDRTVAYHAVYAKIMGSVAGGVWLSQILYWDGVKENESIKAGKEYDGWFYEIDREIREQTGLSDRELRSAKAQAKSLGIMTITRGGMPAKTYYKIDLDKLIELISSYTADEPVRTVEANKFVQNHAQNDPQMSSEMSAYIAVSSKTEETETPKVRFFPKSLIDTEDKPKKKEPKHRDLPIAVQKFYEVRHKTPPKETWAMIQDSIGTEKKDLDFWKDVLVEYAALGWNPMNISGALEWFKKRELPHTNGKEKTEQSFTGRVYE